MTIAPEVEFQNLMVRSAVPPPEASRLRCHGHLVRVRVRVRANPSPNP